MSKAKKTYHDLAVIVLRVMLDSPPITIPEIAKIPAIGSITRAQRTIAVLKKKWPISVELFRVGRTQMARYSVSEISVERALEYLKEQCQSSKNYEEKLKALAKKHSIAKVAAVLDRPESVILAQYKALGIKITMNKRSFNGFPELTKMEMLLNRVMKPNLSTKTVDKFSCQSS